jgi:hypothetical protein
MSQYMSVEISGEMIADLMAEDANFAAEVLRTIADRVAMGGLKDDASDIAAGMSHNLASFMATQFIDLGEAMKNGYNMANHTQI